MKTNTTFQSAWSLALIVGAVLTPPAAQAYFEVRNQEGENGGALPQTAPPADYQVMATRRGTALVEYGQPNDASIITGFGRDIPLDVAVEMLIPDQWVVYSNPKVDSSQTVSWNEGGSWVDTLRHVAEQAAVEMAVDWNRRQVMIEQTRVEHMSAQQRAERGAPGLHTPTDGGVHHHLDDRGYVLSVQEDPQSLDEFVNAPVSVDVRAATVEQAFLALLPPGWTVEMIGIESRFQHRRLDFTTPKDESRGRAMHVLGVELGISISPFPHLRKVILSDAI